MKLYPKLISTLLILAMLISTLASCKKADGGEESENPVETTLWESTLSDPEAVFLHGSLQGDIYGDFVFLSDQVNCVSYNFLDEPSPYSIPLYDPSLGGASDNPFKGNGAADIILVDKKASAENGGTPILYIVVGTNKIIRFNMEDNSTQIIKEKIPNRIISLSIYGDTIIYGTSDADEGLNIHSIDKNGENYKKLDNPDKLTCRVQTGYKNKLYFIDQKTMVMYRCNLPDLTGLEKVFDAHMISYAFAHNGYIYYSDNQHSESVAENVKKPVFDLYRRSLDNMEEKEVIVQNITNGYYYEGKYYYFLLENCRPVVNHKGNTTYDAGITKGYIFDPKTGENKLLYDLGNDHKYIGRWPIGASEDNILFDCRTQEELKFYVYVNVNDMKEIRIPQ